MASKVVFEISTPHDDGIDHDQRVETHANNISALFDHLSDQRHARMQWCQDTLGYQPDHRFTRELVAADAFKKRGAKDTHIEREVWEFQSEYDQHLFEQHWEGKQESH